MSAISQGFANDFHEWYSQNLKLSANHLNSNHKSWFKIIHIFISYMLFDALTHWGRATHICVGKLTTIGSDNGLSPGRRQAIIWTIAGILLIGPLGTNFNDILFEIRKFSFTKMHLKMSSAKLRPFSLGPNVLKHMYIDENTSELPILTLSTKTAYNCDVRWMWGACITTSTLHWKQKNVILITLSSLVATYVLMTTYVATSDDKVVEWTILCFQCSDYSQNNSRDAVPSQSWYWSIEAWTKGLKFCSPHSEMHNHSSSNFYPRKDVWINIDEQPKPHQN